MAWIQHSAFLYLFTLIVIEMLNNSGKQIHVPSSFLQKYERETSDHTEAEESNIVYIDIASEGNEIILHRKYNNSNCVAQLPIACLDY